METFMQDPRGRRQREELWEAEAGEVLRRRGRSETRRERDEFAAHRERETEALRAHLERRARREEERKAQRDFEATSAHRNRSGDRGQHHHYRYGPPRPPSPPFIRIAVSTSPRGRRRRGLPRYLLVRELLGIFYQNGRGRVVLKRNEMRNRLIRSFQVTGSDVHVETWDHRNWRDGDEDGRRWVWGPSGGGGGDGGHGGGGIGIRVPSPSRGRYPRKVYAFRDEDGRAGDLRSIPRATERLFEERRRREDERGRFATGSGHGPRVVVEDWGGTGDLRSRGVSTERSGRGASIIASEVEHNIPARPTHVQQIVTEDRGFGYDSGRVILRGGRGSDGHVWFFLMRDGEICTLHEAAEYEKGHLNWYLRDMLNEQYTLLRLRRGWKPLRELAFAYFHLWECVDHERDYWELTDSASIVDLEQSTLSGKPITSHFRYLLRNTPRDKRWTVVLDSVLDEGEDRRRWRDFVVMVEIIEGMNTGAIYAMAIGLIIASAIIGIVYSAVTKEVSDGFSVASYAVTASAFVVAVFAAGEWFGLESPDSFGESTMSPHERVIGRVLLDKDPHDRKHEDV
ncbi:hypothetical protein K458DRAFT_488990 [Lentithecium fluviatile CBS 122367]|uniref:Uncharacterized protein n=1 Tax=Lentithecium fluviatile CBS 122367 TaxID=1168545 RepID=A0A6G1IVB0_9PLEO|nr:hypothetical protein K458DRAFT_488990 [Lentithecium fluviatile CBS 122367]